MKRNKTQIIHLSQQPVGDLKTKKPLNLQEGVDKLF